MSSFAPRIAASGNGLFTNASPPGNKTPHDPGEP
jgi:hypothetical protein